MSVAQILLTLPIAEAVQSRWRLVVSICQVYISYGVFLLFPNIVQTTGQPTVDYCSVSENAFREEKEKSEIKV